MISLPVMFSNFQVPLHGMTLSREHLHIWNHSCASFSQGSSWFGSAEMKRRNYPRRLLRRRFLPYSPLHVHNPGSHLSTLFRLSRWPRQPLMARCLTRLFEYTWSVIRGLELPFIRPFPLILTAGPILTSVTAGSKDLEEPGLIAIAGIENPPTLRKEREII